MRLPLAIAMFCGLVGQASAQHEIETGRAILCDTRSQIEKIAALDAEGSSVQTVNASEPNACVFAEVAYIRGYAHGRVHLSKHTFEVVEVLVLGFKNSEQWQKLPQASIQWTLFPVAEEDA